MPRRSYAIVRELEGNPIVDDRKRPNRTRGPRKPTPYKKEQNKWERRHIVAWDGEGANLEDGEHVYNLLANSEGRYIRNDKGLSTFECFVFFLSESDPGDINVIYGGSYDINMILRDVPKDKLLELWNDGRCFWQGFRILWASRKKFTIQEIRGAKVFRSFVLWDVLGYFQRTFVMSCRLWLGDLPVLDRIAEMKNQRETFRVEDIEDIIQYNSEECALLVLLMIRLFSSLDEADLKLRRYDGAGSIAAAILAKYNIKFYKGVIPREINRVTQFAYSGGRIEAIKIGTTSGAVRSIYRYDINSAYPAATVSLPSYRGASWVRGKTWDGSNNSLVAVQWSFRNESPFYPLWYRDNNGGISYPRQGRGIFWGVEIANLYKYYQEGVDFDVEYAYNCKIVDETKPFAFMEELYAIRRKFAKAGSMASESLKLGYNSVYGKLVQQAGYREGRIPTYHQLLWGGQITAYTRARLFDTAMQQPNSIIAFATDAIFSSVPLDVKESKKLGEWTADSFFGITMVQAGVYFLQNEDGTWGEKYRGFDKGSIDRDEIVRCWEEGTEYEATTSRFVGLGSAIASNDFSIWRTWQNNKVRALDIRPTGKRIAGRYKTYHTGLRTTKAAPNITPEVMSKAYPLEWEEGYKLADLDGNVRVLIDEEEDGRL
jgi:DNA polymerase type B, organellar and viral